jgi:phosphopantetheine adenylyltransferase
MKSFKQFLKEQRSDTLYFTFGRFDPPTLGHEHLFTVLKVEATTHDNSDWLIFPTRKTNYKDTFIPAEDKIRYMKELYPRVNSHIVDNPDIKTVIDIMEKYKYNKYVMIVGVPDVEGMKRFERYAPEGTTLEVPMLPSLKRTEGDGVQGISSSKLKELVANATEENMEANKAEFIKGIGNETVGTEIFDSLIPYQKQLNKYIIAKGKK